MASHMGVNAGKVTDSSGNAIFRNVTHYKASEVPPEVRIYRLDTNIFFASVEDLHDELMDRTDALLVAPLPSSPPIPSSYHRVLRLAQDLS